MKPILNLFLVGALGLLAGCSEDTGLTPTDDSRVSFTLSFEEGVKSRAFSDGTSVNQVTYAIYHGSDNPITNKVDIGAPIEVALSKGETYTVVFWADRKDKNAYTFSADKGEVTVDYTKVTPNDDGFDAFFATRTLTISGASTVNVELTRPFAQLNIGTTSISGAGFTPADITTVTELKDVPTVLNLKDGTVTGTANVTFPAVGVPTSENYPVNGYEYLSMCYILCAPERTIASPMLTTIKNGNQDLARVEMNNVSVQRNFRTNVYGSLLSGTTVFMVTIQKGFAGDNENEPEPVSSHIDNGKVIYEIGSKEALEWVREQIDKNTNWWSEGRSIQLISDIDLGGIVWTPINITNTSGEMIVIDGNSKTVSNFKLKAENNQGLFGTAQNVEIKDLGVSNVELKDENATVENVGALAGNLSGRLTNVRVERVTIELTNGNNIGGVVGKMTATGVKASTSDPYEKVFATVSVSNSSIRGNNNVGGFTGLLDNDASSRAGANDVMVASSGIHHVQVWASTTPTMSPSRAGQDPTVGLVAGGLSDNEAVVWYDEFENGAGNGTDLFIGSNNSAWQKIGGSGGSTTDPGEIPADPIEKDDVTWEIYTIEHLRTVINTIMEAPKGNTTITLMADID